MWNMPWPASACKPPEVGSTWHPTHAVAVSPDCAGNSSFLQVLRVPVSRSSNCTHFFAWLARVIRARVMRVRLDFHVLIGLTGGTVAQNLVCCVLLNELRVSHAAESCGCACWRVLGVASDAISLRAFKKMVVHTSFLSSMLRVFVGVRHHCGPRWCRHPYHCTQFADDETAVL